MVGYWQIGCINSQIQVKERRSYGKQRHLGREKVQKILEREFKTTFERNKTITVGRNSNGETKTHKFDLVSTNGKIVVEVKSCKFKNKRTQKSEYNSTRKWRILGDCFYLSKAKGAKKRLMVLTNKELYTQFKNDMDGLLDPKIEIRYIPIR